MRYSKVLEIGSTWFHWFHLLTLCKAALTKPMLENYFVDLLGFRSIGYVKMKQEVWLQCEPTLAFV